MYTKRIPFKDLNGKPQNGTVNFYFFEREVFGNIVSLQSLFKFIEDSEGPERQLAARDVQEFYTNLEEVLLNAWCIPSADGQSLDRDGRYEFEKTALFNGTMVYFLEAPTEIGELLQKIMPEGMDNIVKKAEENIAKAASEAETPETAARIRQLEEQLKSAKEGNVIQLPTPE